MRIAITTPTGSIGSRLVDSLAEDAEHDLVLLLRDPIRSKAQASRHLSLRTTDLQDRHQVVQGLKDADLAFLVVPAQFDSPDYRAFQRTVGGNYAAAIRENNIKRAVFVSSYGAQHSAGTGPIAGLHDVEEGLSQAAYDVGCDLVHLRPVTLMENWLNDVPTIKSKGVVYAPISGDQKIPMIAAADVAKVARDLIRDPSWRGIQVRELIGPREYSLGEGVRIISRVIGQPIELVEVPADKAIKIMTDQGVSQNVARSLVEMYDGIQKGLVKVQGDQVPQTRTPTKFEDFARRHLAPVIRS